MENLQTIDTSILLDMLTKHTEDYTKMRQGENIGKDFNTLKVAIDALQSELIARHHGVRQTA